ncbi:hypothetical protein [Xanthobacter sp. KR7-225]|uniref:hypothetical protein n=1 Tax=Xanthobacter sp. KR7-225 TaxID=3156613 RepID=UPI0032B34B8F
MDTLPNHLIACRFFDPREQSILTGVEQSRQRVIRARVALPFENAEPIIMERKRMMGWSDIMRWAILGEVSGMGIGLEESAYFASSKRFDDLIPFDFRRPEGGHLFAVCQPVRGNPESFANVTTFGGTNQYPGGVGTAFFGLDFSDLQARVLQRLDTL